jgi:iron complex outermembrane receptor protein
VDQLPFIDGQYGRLQLGLNATYLDSYKYRNRIDEPFVDGAGKRNAGTGFIPPAPRWRANTRLAWGIGSHSMSLLGRYNHHLPEDEPLCNLGLGTLRALGSTMGDRPRGCPGKLRSQMEWDLQYQMQMYEVLGASEASFTIGAINLFDTMPLPSVTFGGMETYLYDPRGRQLYARFAVRF